MHKAVLDHFGFSRLPFSKVLSSKETFPTHSYTEAVSRLENGIASEDFLAKWSCNPVSAISVG